MDLIDSVSDLQKNLDTLETYRNSVEATYREFYKELIKRGRCFVVYSRDNNTHFAPSRFIGYKHNDMNSHWANHEKDGRETNPVIDRIVGKQSEQSETTEIEYQKFCNELGIEPWKVKKKFWKI